MKEGFLKLLNAKQLKVLNIFLKNYPSSYITDHGNGYVDIGCNNSKLLNIPRIKINDIGYLLEYSHTVDQKIIDNIKKITGHKNIF
jgi:hypothetical protein